MFILQTCIVAGMKLLLHAFKDDGHDIMFAIVHVLATTGLRNEEFCKLQISSVMVDRINGGHFIKVDGKGNKKREIPLQPKVYKSILLFREVRGLLPIEQAKPEDPLFTTNTGKPYTPSYFSQYVKKEIEKTSVLKNSKLTITPHVFRHAFTIISSKNGADIYAVMRALGHTKLETTEIYMEKVFAKERHAIHTWDSNKFGEFI